MRKYQAAALAGLVGLLSTSCGKSFTKKLGSHEISVPLPASEEAIRLNCDSYVDVYVPDTKKSNIELEGGKHYCRSLDGYITVFADTEYDGRSLARLTIDMSSTTFGNTKFSCTQVDETVCGQAFKAVENYINSELDKL